MRLLDRYLLRELLIPLSYCLGGFLLFWVAFDLFANFSQFVRKGLAVGDIAEYYLAITPEFLVLVLPIALLLGLLYSLTNHARHQELVAIRAAGVSIWRLSLPYFLVGFIFSLAVFALNELWVPQSSETAQLILDRNETPNPELATRHANLCFVNAREGRNWIIGTYDSATGEMIRPEVFWTDEEGGRLRLKADRAVYTNGAWSFSNALQYLEVSGTNAFPQLMFQTNLFDWPELNETPELVNSEIKVSGSMGLAPSKGGDLSISEILNYLRLHPQPSRSDRHWLKTKLQGRFAAPWTCLVVVLIAIPFGAASGRRNVFVGVASSIMIAFTFFVLQQVALALGTSGLTPAWVAAWLPNLVFGLTGLWLTARVR